MITQKHPKNPAKELVKNLILKLKTQLLQERSLVLRKFKNKLEKPLKNFKVKVQRVRVRNTEKKKEISTVKKRKMSLLMLKLKVNYLR
jgi:hypothetical protein